MVAVVSGSGLGLFGSSLSILGGGGVFGNPQAGRNGERIYVNTATGNLVIQRQDEFLTAQGLDVVPLRTYNSLGVAANDGDNSDNWRNGLLQKLYAETGTRNTSGATITKVFRDGREVVYTYSTARSRYESTEGDGAHDTLTWNGTVWTWTDGSARNTETYNTSGRLDSARDADQNLVTYTYTGTLLTSINDQSGQITTLTYHPSTNDLASVQVVSNSVTQTLVRYTYDASHRLQTVKVDLTPLDNSIVDNNVYTTTYTYSSTSTRVASITQSDGSAISFTYQTLNGASRLKTYTVTNADGGNRTTTFNYGTYNSGGAVYATTDVVDPLGLTTTYTHSTTAGASGRLLNLKSPTVNGARLETAYLYDSEGNVTQITEDPTGLNRQTVFTYDATFNGNLLSSRDSLGNTVTRTYNANNQLLTETRYIVRDPDGSGSGLPSSPLVTRYAYDSENHLRFVISADGRVTEHRYNAVGQRILTLKFVNANYTAAGFTEANLQSWVGTLTLEKPERIDYVYDFRGNLTTMTAWNSTVAATFAGSGTPSITRFVYDQRGQLLQTIDARGEATTGDANDFKTTYTYDSLGRLLTTTEWLSSSSSRTTSTAYTDATRTDVTTSANGLITTRVYNQANELINVAYGTAEALGTTTYKYDLDGRLRVVTDPTLVRQVYLYDEAGRKVAYVDGDGSLTEYIYNRASQLIKAVQYATKVTSAVVDGSGNPTAVTLTTLRTEANPAGTTALNRITRNVYDVSGARVYTIDESGAVIKFSYDGAGRLIEQLAYATPITVPAATDQLLPSDLTTTGSPTLVSTSVDDRLTRNFYDGDGNLRGTLDGKGYLVEYMYDHAGHLVQQVAYANQVTPATLWPTGTLDALRTAAGTDNEIAVDPEKDITTNFYYDGQGRLIGVMDGERFWTETAYTAAGQKSSVTRYDPTLATYTTSLTWQQTHDAVAALPGLKSHVTSYQYDGAGRVTQETNWELTVTTYAYDHADNVTATTAASGTGEARQRLFRYDFLGRVTQELSAEGAALLPGVLPANVENHWLAFGIKYTYDLAGRRVTAEARPNDTQTNLTRYFYDNDGRLRFEVNQLGERKEYRYNALGQLTNEIKYTTPLLPAVMSALANGGLLTSGLITTLTGSTHAGDALTSYTYSLIGKVASISVARNATVGENALTTHTYNVFGQEKQRLQSIDATNTLQHDYTYDTRGLLTQTRWDPTLNITEARTYDAFGRLTSITDGRLNIVKRYEYDRLGRETARTDASSSDRTVTAWDAFDRKVTITDAMSAVTSFQYEPQQPAFKTKITTAAGITYVTHNRHGETVTVENRTAADVTINTTSYTYDKNGNLTGTSDTLGTLEGRAYDRGNRHIELTDVRGTKTKLEYDAANRLFRRTVDSAAGGLALVTTYEFDGQGRMTRMTEPGSRVTDYTYDRQGRVTRITVDPSTLNLRTEYAYDRRGLVITMTEGFGVTGTTAAPRRTQYIYDKLGRRIEQIVDPTALGGTLNLRTQFKYDASGNVTRKIEGDGTTPNQRSTWYVYDANNRVTHTIDAMGGVTVNTYDFEDRVVSTRRYATPIATGSLGDVLTTSSFTLTTNTQDRRSQSIFDAAGRAIYTIDAVSDTRAIVTHRTYDALDRVIRQRTAANDVAWNLTTAETPVLSALNLAMTGAGNNPDLGPNDRVQWNAYDARGRLAYKMDSLGGVTKYVYDGDTVVSEKAYVTLKTSGTNDLTGFNAFETTNGSNVNNRVTRYWYDTLNRLRFTLVANSVTDANSGYLTEQRYDDAARIETQIVYSDLPTASGAVIVAQGATLATVSDTIAAPIAANKRQTTVTTRDVAGRIVSVRDALLRTEYFGYDALGNRTSYTNKKGASAGDAAYTWNYEYDAAGRLTKEKTPLVAVTSVTASGDTLTASTGSPVRIETVMTYDAFGNVKTRTEAANVAGQSRTTDYSYDSLGRQTVILYPGVALYNPATGDTQLSGTLTLAGSTTSSSTRPTSTTTYDVFGNATRNVDVAGFTSYKVYDNLGRLRYEIDALNFVTEHTYDSFGNELTLTRYNSGSFVVPAFTNGRLPFSTVGINVTAIAVAANDRTIIKQYDRVNRLIKVTQPPVFNYLTAENATANSIGTVLSSVGAETVTDYNAFGQVVRMGQLVATGTYADTFFYYDKRGMKIAQVDPLKQLTLFQYDETGDLTRQVEYSRPITGTPTDIGYSGVQTTTRTNALGNPNGYDREIKFEYDQLNRKTKETRVDLEYTSISGTTPSVQYADQVTTFGYDHLGNQTRVTANGVDTYTYYDVLGRVTAIAEPLRDRGDGTNLRPVIFMFRDALGNLVKQVAAANGANNTPTETTFPTYAANTSKDRETVMLVDSHGRIVQTYQVLSDGAPATAADSTARYTTYNARGQVAKEWQKVTNAADELLITFYQYDALGRQIKVIEPQKITGGAVLARTISAYNSFGEITSKQVETSSTVNGSGTAMPGIEKFEYDQAGRVWRTNSGDGVWKVYLYDLLGNATAEIKARIKTTGTTTDLGAPTGVSPLSAHNLGGDDAIRKETFYDKLGRVKEQREVTFTAANSQETITAPVTVETFSGAAYLHLQVPGDPTLTTRIYINGVERTVVTLSTGTESGYNKGVNLTALSLASGTYSYRITFTRPTDSTPIAATEGTFSYTVAANATIGLTSTSAVGTVSGVTAQFSGGNTVIRWTASSGSVNSAQVEVRSGAGAWTTHVATFSTNWGATFAQLSPGTYEYRITNFIGGITHSIGRGTLTVTAPTTSTTTNSITPDPSYVAIGTVTASATAQAQASGTKVSSSTAIWNPIFDEGVQVGQEAVWSGTNSASLSWINVGSQALTVRLHYRTLTGLDTFRDQSVAAGAGNTGMTFNWTDPLPPGAQSHGHGGFQQINGIEVFSSGGTLLRSSGVTVSNTQLVWTAPVNTSFQADFSYKVAGTSTWTTVAAVRNGSGQFVVSAPGLVAGTYDFQILQYILSGETAQNASTKSGQFTVSGASASVISQTGDPPYIAGVTASGSQFSWALATGGATVSVTLRNASNVVVATLTPSTGNNVNFTASYNAVASGTYRYVIEYTVSGTVTARGTGSITITTSPVASTITPTAPTNIGSAIVGFQDLGGGLFGWTTAPTTPASDVLRLRYKPAGAGSWTATLTPTLVGGFYRVSLLSLASGSYDFEVSYTTSTDTAPYRVGGGRISVTPFNTYSGTVTPTALPTLTSTPRQKQDLDRWGNAINVHTIFQERQPDGSVATHTNTTKYRYNQRGQLVETTLPDTATLQVNRTTGAWTEYTAATAPDAISYNYYDVLGRLIGTRDANGNLNQIRYNVAGQVTAEIAADNPNPDTVGSPRTSYVYNAFGEQIQTTDEAGYRVRSLYDRGGRLIRTAAEIASGALGGATVVDPPAWAVADATKVVKEYRYDQAGRRLSETNGEVKSDNSTRETRSYSYDLLGNVIGYGGNLGSFATISYDALGRKISQTDGNAATASWTYDYFGHLTAHTDFGGTVYTYVYDTNLSWLLKSQTSTGGQTGGTGGQNKAYEYDEANRLKKITDTGHVAADTSRDVDRITQYIYDSAGRRAHERTFIDDIVHQDTRTRYDAAGRVSQVSGRGFSVSYSYDLTGNRTRIDARYANNNGVTPQTLWYNYDQMNRVTLSQGENQAGSVILGANGTVLTYDARGVRTMATTGGGREMYSYDGLARLDTTTRQDLVEIDESGNPVYSSPYTTSDRDYDRASRVTGHLIYAFDSGAGAFVTRQTTTVYNDAGLVASQTTQKKGTDNVFRNESITTYGSESGYDAVGNVKEFVTNNYQSNGTALSYSSTHTYFYVTGEGYQERQHTVDNSALFADGTTTNTYNPNGELIRFIDQNDGTKNRYFANNAAGQALTVVKGSYSTDPSSAFASAVGGSGFFSTTNAGYTFFSSEGQQVGTFGNFEGSVMKANFDVNFTPISPTYPSSVPANYVVQKGDTLRRIAATIFGDGNLWYLIAQANGLSDPDVVLAEGRTLEIPNQVVSLANNATTFKPFDPTEALGDTTPTQPFIPPPRKKGCGTLGMILIAVVAIVVTVFTAGVAAGASGTLASIMGTGASVLTGTAAGVGIGASVGYAALGGAVGSIVSQGVAIATGMQEGFDWRGVALGAIGAGVTAGLGGLAAQGTSAFAQGFAAANNFTYGALGGAAGSALTQGVSVLTGLQEHFSWRDVAVSAIAAPLAAQAGGLAGAGLQRFGSGIAAFGSRFVAGATGSLVRGAIGGTIDTNTILADAFGNAIGNGIVDALTPTPIGITPEQWADVDRQLSEGFRATQLGLAAQIAIENNIALSVTNNPQVAVPRLSFVEAGQSLWNLARSDLGSDAADAEVLLRTQQYMQINNIADPTGLQEGEGLLVPLGNESVSEATRQAYEKSDQLQNAGLRQGVVTVGQLPTFTTGLGSAVDTYVGFSTVLTQQLSDLAKQGISTEYGPAGEGSYLGRKRIVVDIRSRNNPLAVVATLAHEAGHALDPRNVHPFGYSNADDYVNAALSGEGWAEINRGIIKADILSSNGPSINTAFAKSPSDEALLQASIAQFQAAGGSGPLAEKAAMIVGEKFRSKPPSGFPYLTYDAYYREGYVAASEQRLPRWSTMNFQNMIQQNVQSSIEQSILKNLAAIQPPRL